ncbi:MAG: Maebl [Rhodobacteraceae bacterium]|nr:MAG: Maebl [Paracoccaceae bacterium]
MFEKEKRIAVLIDADNISPKWAEAIFDEIASFGEATVRRIYGDFTNPQLKSWTEKFATLALIPHLQIANTVGKNSSDIALVIDGMDLLHSGRVDAFCLVSSDSDFTRLASRIREQGLPVYGIGQRKTPEAFRMACRRFIFVENLLEAEEPASAGSAKQPAALKKAPLSKSVPLILQAMRGLDSDGEWFVLPEVRSKLVTIKSDFDQRTYGYEKLGELFEATGQFEVDRDAKPARVRRKPSNNKKAIK